jgi:hypothetical protein
MKGLGRTVTGWGRGTRSRLLWGLGVGRVGLWRLARIGGRMAVRLWPPQHQRPLTLVARSRFHLAGSGFRLRGLRLRG